MMRIKVKKTMTLSELIEWAWENPELTNNKKILLEVITSQVLLNFLLAYVELSQLTI